MKLNSLNGHYDEAAELEDWCDGGNQNELTLLKEFVLEVPDLHDDSNEGDDNFNANIDHVLVCKVIQGIVFWVLYACELINIDSNYINSTLQAIWAKALIKNKERIHTTLFKVWGVSIVTFLLAYLCCLRYPSRLL